LFDLEIACPYIQIIRYVNRFPLMSLAYNIPLIHSIWTVTLWVKTSPYLSQSRDHLLIHSIFLNDIRGFLLTFPNSDARLPPLISSPLQALVVSLKSSHFGAARKYAKPSQREIGSIRHMSTVAAGKREILWRHLDLRVLDVF